MEDIEKIYDETMDEIERFNPEVTFKKVIDELNEKTGRRIVEFYIEFNDVAKSSVGNKKNKKKTEKIKSTSAILMLGLLLFSMTACKSNSKNNTPENTSSYYQEVLDTFELDLAREAYNKGTKIGSDLLYSSMMDYYEGNSDIIDAEDIINEIAYLIKGDNWYLLFDTNFSVVDSESIDDYKYDVASLIYEGIIDSLNDKKWPSSLNDICKNLVGNNLVYFDSESNELVWVPLDHELTEEDIVTNTIELSKYYINKNTEVIRTKNNN